MDVNRWRQQTEIVSKFNRSIKVLEYSVRCRVQEISLFYKSRTFKEYNRKPGLVLRTEILTVLHWN